MPNNETWEVELDKKWLHYFGKNAGGEVRHPFYESNRNFIREQLTLARREARKEVLKVIDKVSLTTHSNLLTKGGYMMKDKIVNVLSPTSITRNEDEHA